MHAVRAILCLLISLVVCSSSAAAFAEDEAALRQIKEVDWPKAYREQDARLLDRILASEFQSIDAYGAWSTKSEELEYVRKHKPTHELRFVIKRLEVLENNTAVVAGTGIITERGGAELVVTEYQSSNIFIKREGRWQAIASHVSGVKEQSQAKQISPAR
jgi:hypothetical protein